MLDWYIVTSAVYEDAKTNNKLSDDYLYFLSDTRQIMRGAVAFTDAVEMYTGEKPATPAANRLYINSATLEGSVYSATSKTWTTVIHPVAASLTSTDTTVPVSGKAVADFVSEQIANVTGSAAVVTGVAYDSATAKLTVTTGDGQTAETVMNGIAATMAYDNATGALTISDKGGSVLSTVNLDLERFVSEASYDAATNKITLKFNDESEPLVIDVAGLVDTYTVADTATVDLEMANNEITANVKVSAEAKNILTAKADGLYVAETDLSGHMAKVATGNDGKILVAGADGSAVASTFAAGGATLSAAPDANTLATEAAVEAIRAALAANVATKMNMVAAGKADEILVATADGHAAVSGTKIGGAALSDAPNAATLATEKAVAAYADAAAAAAVDAAIVTNGNLATSVAAASDDKVASEKALVNALTWKTTIA